MSTQRLPRPGDRVPGPAPADTTTRALGPIQKYTRRRYMLFHLVFTFRLIGRCLADPRVAPGRKVVFLGVTGLLLLALLVPEATADALALLLPLIGPALDLVGLPVEGAVDWGFFVLAVGSLMGLFPPEVLRQHIIELRGGSVLPGPLPPR